MGLGRDYIGIDLNAAYLPMARARLTDMEAPTNEPQHQVKGVLDLFGDKE